MVDQSRNKIEFKDSKVGDIGSVGANSTGSINKTKKANQKLLIGITLIVGVMVLGILFYFGKIDSVSVETDGDKTKLEIKATETQTPQTNQAPSTKSDTTQSTD